MFVFLASNVQYKVSSVVLTTYDAACLRDPLVKAHSAPTVCLQVYGKYFAKLSKKVQSELAEANGVAEEVLSTMTTVKAHGAQVGGW